MGVATYEDFAAIFGNPAGCPTVEIDVQIVNCKLTESFVSYSTAWNHT